MLSFFSVKKMLSIFLLGLCNAVDLKAAIGKPAPGFTAEAVVDGEFKQVNSYF